MKKTPLKRPKVSLGLPVFNGENYLSETLDSILCQTFSDFELLISDNASTDNTQQICEEYAHRDARVRYIRQPENMGAAANYDFVFNHSSGRYFKWCAHDDLLGETFLECCVNTLDEDPKAVGAMPKDVQIIDANRNHIKNVKILLVSEAETPLSRFGSILKDPNFHCSPFFSLFVRDKIEQTGLHGNFLNSDRVFVAEMLLHGKLIGVPNCQFFFRRHEDQFSKAVWRSQSRALEWLAPEKKGQRTFRSSRYLFEHFRAIHRARPGLFQTFGAYSVVLRIAWSKRKDLIRELMWPLFRNGEMNALGRAVLGNRSKNWPRQK